MVILLSAVKSPYSKGQKQMKFLNCLLKIVGVQGERV